MHYTLGDEKYVRRVFVFLVPVIYPNLISFYFFVAIICSGGRLSFWFFERGFRIPFKVCEKGVLVLEREEILTLVADQGRFFLSFYSFLRSQLNGNVGAG